MPCWRCGKPTGGALVCEACSAVQQPVAGADRFAQLGVERRYDLTAGELEARYRELARKLHPDRFARADARERMLSLQASTALNEAYRALRSPVARAEYLLELAGVPVKENDGVDQAFLMEILELREALLEAKLAGDAARVAAMGAEIRARADAAMAAVASGFAGHARSGDRALLAGIKDQLVALRYYQRFLDEQEKT